MARRAVLVRERGGQRQALRGEGGDGQGDKVRGRQGRVACEGRCVFFSGGRKESGRGGGGTQGRAGEKGRGLEGSGPEPSGEWPYLFCRLDRFVWWLLPQQKTHCIYKPTSLEG